MITPTEIRQKAERQYAVFLQSGLKQEPFFPFEIRFGKVKPSDDYVHIKQWVTALLAGSKTELGYGYSVMLETINTRQYGTQSWPTRVAFEAEADYLKFIGKKKEVAAFRQAVALTDKLLPALMPWLTENPTKILPYLADWNDLLQVGRYFQENPRPQLYLRELPLQIHTKFIEEHRAILREMLDAILPETAMRPDESHFERRYFLRYDEPLIRLRVLDETLLQQYHLPVSDMSAPVSQMAQLQWTELRVIITENKLNFLTLPPCPRGVAIFGSGFKVELLAQIPWLIGSPIWYWGDLDAHGFQILSQLRALLPQAVSVMMDMATFTEFQAFAVTGTATTVTHLPHLTEAEQAMFSYLARHNLRLEQERISQNYVIEKLSEALENGY